MCAAIRHERPRHRVLILQHPQEPDKELGTARIANLVLDGSVLRVGLSWPNLRSAWGADAVPSRWAVLYLGAKGVRGDRPLVFVDKKGAPVAPPPALDGIVALDGTWSQAKALWWRNAWLTKLKRAVVVPPRPSLYGRLRREPRREAVSTLEAVGIALTALGEPPAVEGALLDAFRALLDAAAATSARMTR